MADASDGYYSYRRKHYYYFLLTWIKAIYSAAAAQGSCLAAACSHILLYIPRRKYVLPRSYHKCPTNTLAAVVAAIGRCLN